MAQDDVLGMVLIVDIVNVVEVEVEEVTKGISFVVNVVAGLLVVVVAGGYVVAGSFVEV